MSLQKEEKRRSQRVDLHAAMRYQVRGTPDFDNAITDNISEGGLAFNSLKFIPPATPVMLEVCLLSRILHPIGRVSWCQPLPHSNRSRLGVEFLEFESSEKKHLSDYIGMQRV
jgi:c-di-GMP-binding flagellar brake protein YcgR